MITLDNIAALRVQVNIWKAEGHHVAFVPTMGNLHAGHLSLFETAKHSAADADVKLVASVFVNPLQFGPDEDYDTYPRSLERDSAELERLGVDLLFAPDVDEIYPDGQHQQTRVVPPAIGDILEGDHRPGFFTGVATVVNKLFNMVQPDIAVFGQKDYQQLLVIRHMVKDMAIPVRIVSAPTVREADGLAMSSRNQYLDAEERETAAKLNTCLDHLVTEVEKGTDFQYAVMHATREMEELGFLVDYVVVRRQSDLQVPVAGDSELIVLVAARLGSTRLIDNKCFSISAT